MKNEKFSFLERKLDDGTTLKIINQIKNGNFSQKELSQLSQEIWLKLQQSQKDLIKMRSKI